MPYIIDKGKTIAVNTNPSNSKPGTYPKSDLHHCAVHYDPKTGKNVEAEEFKPPKE